MNKKNQTPIIAVDGPAGSGKSTLSKALATRLGMIYLNTGLLYRAIAFVAGENGIDVEHEKALLSLLDDFQSHFRWELESHKLYYKDSDITSLLADETLGKKASILAKYAELRLRLLPLQRELAYATKVGAILDGRDIGTVVFPHALVKFFVTATIEERAQRRLAQLKKSSPSSHHLPLNLEELKNQIKHRDDKDSQRAAAPFLQAEDAILIDTSGKTFEESVEEMYAIIQKRLH